MWQWQQPYFYMKHIDNILACDNQILVADKPAGMATQPDFVDAMKAWVKERFQKPGNVFLEPIHRLDKPVAGLVLFARTSKALSRLQEQMRERQIEKKYEAWVETKPPQEKATLRHILTHGSFRAHLSPEGKEAVLEYEVIKEERGLICLQIRLQTGRYHQIRAQLAAIGCSIVGDSKYGSKKGWKEGIALVATEIAFTHPVTQEPLRFARR